MAADRRAHRRWFDARLAIGLALVVASVVAVVWIVGAADTTVTVLAARQTLTPGHRVRQSDLVERRVRLGVATDRYLTSLPAAGVVVTRTVSSGELVPRSATGSAAALSSTSVVIPIRGELADSIDPGSVVDLWAARQTDQERYDPPTVLVPRAIVVRISTRDGILDSGSGTSVELLVARSRTARVLEAIANSDALSLVASAAPGSSG